MNLLTVMDRNLLPSFTSAATVPNMSPAELPSAASQFSQSVEKENVPSQDQFRNDTVQAALAKGSDVDPKELAMKLLAGIATKTSLDKPIGSRKLNTNESLPKCSKQDPSSSSNCSTTSDESGPKFERATKQPSPSSITANSEINASDLALKLLARASPHVEEQGGGNCTVPPFSNVSDSSRELEEQGLPEAAENVKSNGPEALGAQLLASSAFNSSSDGANSECKNSHEEKGSVSPEVLKKISQREFVERSRTIAENVVLGPATVHNETENGSNSKTNSSCISSGTLNFASLTSKSLANASALANKLLQQTSVVNQLREKTPSNLKPLSEQHSSQPASEQPSPPKPLLEELSTKQSSDEFNPAIKLLEEPCYPIQLSKEPKQPKLLLEEPSPETCSPKPSSEVSVTNECSLIEKDSSKEGSCISQQKTGPPSPPKPLFEELCTKQSLEEPSPPIPLLEEPCSPKPSSEVSATNECSSIEKQSSNKSSCISQQKTDRHLSKVGPKAIVNNSATSSIGDTICITPTTDSINSPRTLCSVTNDLSDNPGNPIMCTPMKDLSKDNGNSAGSQQLNILDMLSEMADQAGTEDAATSEERSAENWCTTTKRNPTSNNTSVTSSLPKSIIADSDLPPASDNIPMPSNITFEFSIDSLLNSEEDQVLPDDKQPELGPKNNPVDPSISDESLTISKTNDVQHLTAGPIKETEKTLNVSSTIKSVPQMQKIDSFSTTSVPVIQGIVSSATMSFPKMQGIVSSDATVSVPQMQGNGPPSATSVPQMQGISPSSATISVPQIQGNGLPSATTSVPTSVPQMQGISPSSATMSVPQMQGIGTSSATTSVPQMQGISPSSATMSVPLMQGNGTSSAMSVPLMQGNGTSSATTSVPQMQGINCSSSTMSVPLMQGIGTSLATTSVPQIQGNGAPSATTSVPQMQGISPSSATMLAPLMQGIGTSSATTSVRQLQETCQRESDINVTVGAIQMANASNVDSLPRSEPTTYVSPSSQFSMPSTHIHLGPYSPRQNAQSPRLGAASHLSMTDSTAGHSDGPSSRGSTPGASAKTPPTLPYSAAVHPSNVPLSAIARPRSASRSNTPGSVSHTPPSVALPAKPTSRESNHRHSSSMSYQAALYGGESRPSESLENYNPALNQTFTNSVANSYAEKPPGYQLPHSSPSCQFPSGNNHPSDPLDGMYFPSQLPGESTNNSYHTPCNETINMPPNRSVMNNNEMPQYALGQSNRMESNNFYQNSWTGAQLNQNVSFTQGQTGPYMPANPYPQSGSSIQGQQGLQTQHSSRNPYNWQDNRPHSLQDQEGIGHMNSFNLRTTQSTTQPISPPFMEPSNSNQNNQYGYGQLLRGVADLSQCQPQPPGFIHQHRNNPSTYQSSRPQHNSLMAPPITSTRAPTIPNFPPVLRPHHIENRQQAPNFTRSNPHVSGMSRTLNPSNLQRGQLQERTQFIAPNNVHGGLNNQQRPPMRGPLSGPQRHFSPHRPQTAKRMVSPKLEQGISSNTLQQSSHSTPTPTSRLIPQGKTSDKTSNQSTQQKDKDSDTQQVAALIVESVLRGQPTGHVEEQIRRVNEILKSAPTRNLLSSASSSASTASTDSTSSRNATSCQARSVSASTTVNRSSASQPKSSAEQFVHSPTVESSTSTAGTCTKSSTASNMNRSPSKSGRTRQAEPMFVDLTDDRGAADMRESVLQQNPNSVKQALNNPLDNCSPLHQLSILRKGDLDVHIFIEVVNIKSPLSIFCVLERCMWGTCQPKKRRNCKLSLGWWILQSDRRSSSGRREEDVSFAAAQIIARSQHDKPSFRSEMTKILENLVGKRSEVFRPVATQAVKIIGRAFVRPRTEAGGLYLDAVNQSLPGQTTKSYFEMTKTQNLIALIKAASVIENSTSNPSNVVVIQPLTDAPLPPSEDIPPPNITCSEPIRLQTTNPIIIEPPPTPGPIVIEDSDTAFPPHVNPIVIAPPPTPAPRVSPDEVPIQWVERPQPPPAQHDIDPVQLQSSVPIVIAPPPTPRPPDVQVNTPTVSANASIPAAPQNNRNQSFNPLHQQPQMREPLSYGSNSSVPNQGRSSNVPIVSTVGNSLGLNRCLTQVPSRTSPNIHPPISQLSVVPRQQPSSQIITSQAGLLPQQSLTPQLPQPPPAHQNTQRPFIPPMNLQPTSMFGNMVPNQFPGPQNQALNTNSILVNQLLTTPSTPSSRTTALPNPGIGNNILMQPNNSHLMGPASTIPNFNNFLLYNPVESMNPHLLALLAHTNSQTIQTNAIHPLIPQYTNVSSMLPSQTAPHIPGPISTTQQQTAHPTRISTTTGSVPNVRGPSTGHPYRRKPSPILPRPITSSVTTNAGGNLRNEAANVVSASCIPGNKERTRCQPASGSLGTSVVAANAGETPRNRAVTQASSGSLVTSVVPTTKRKHQTTRPPSFTVPGQDTTTLPKPKDVGSNMCDLIESSFQNSSQPEYVSLEDLMDHFNVDRGSDPCRSATSSVGTEASQRTSTANIMSYLLDSNLESFMTEAGLTTTTQPKKVSIVLKRIEEEHVKMGLTKLSSHSYKLPGALAMLKPKRQKIRHTVYTGSDAVVDDAADPEWSPAVTKEEDEEDAFLDDSDKDTESETDLYSNTSGSDTTILNNDISASFDEDSPIKKVKKRKRRKIISPEPSSDEDELPDIPSNWCIKDDPEKKQSDSDEGKIHKLNNSKKNNVITSDDEEVPSHPCDPVFSPPPTADKLSPIGKDTRQKPIKIVINSSEGITSLVDQSPVKNDRPTDLKCHFPSKNKILISEVNYILRASEVIDYKKLASLFPELQPVVKMERLESVNLKQFRRGRKKQQTKSRKRKASPALPIPNKKKKIVSSLDFFTNDQLWQELNNRQRMVTCVCGMTFVDNELYQCHKACHDSKDPMKCPICQETYSNWHEFTSHSIRSHTNVTNIT